MHRCRQQTHDTSLPPSGPNSKWCSHCKQCLAPPSHGRRNHFPLDQHPFYDPSCPPIPHGVAIPQPVPLGPPAHFVSAGFPHLPTPVGVTRPHPSAPAPVLHNFGGGPTPLFGWESVIPLPHTYGGPRYARRVKPDYRRFCFSVGKAEVPYAALPGGPLQGWNSTMSPQLVGSW
jgi:hypothetical protein